MLVSSLQKPLPTNATLSQSGTKKENHMHRIINGIKYNQENEGSTYFGQQPGHETNDLIVHIFISVRNLFLADMFNVKFK